MLEQIQVFWSSLDKERRLYIMMLDMSDMTQPIVTNMACLIERESILIFSIINTERVTSLPFSVIIGGY